MWLLHPLPLPWTLPWETAVSLFQQSYENCLWLQFEDYENKTLAPPSPRLQHAKMIIVKCLPYLYREVLSPYSYINNLFHFKNRETKTQKVKLFAQGHVPNELQVPNRYTVYRTRREQSEMGWNDSILAGCLDWASRLQILRLVVLRQGGLLLFISHHHISKDWKKKVGAQDWKVERYTDRN